jgi:hypothetical protein
VTPFKDATGRTWTIAITVATVRRVRALCGVDLPGLFDDNCKGLQALTNDVCGFCGVVLVLLADQLKDRQVDEEGFLATMYGEALEASMDAFLAELCDFFPEARKRQALRKILLKSRSLRETLMDRAEETLEAVDIAATARSMMSSSGGPPASSVVTRANGPAANS